MYSVYVPSLDWFFTRDQCAPVLYDELCKLPGAILDPPKRDGGYRTADEATVAAFHRLAFGPPPARRY